MSFKKLCIHWLTRIKRLIASRALCERVPFETPNEFRIMPNTKAAIKSVRTNARKTERNRHSKSRVRTLERNFLKAIESGDKEAAATALKAVYSALDKAAKGSVLHASAAGRKKSRLAAKFNTLAKA